MPQYAHYVQGQSKTAVNGVFGRWPASSAVSHLCNVVGGTSMDHMTSGRNLIQPCDRWAGYPGHIMGEWSYQTHVMGSSGTKS